MTPLRSLARALLGGMFIAAGAQAILKPARYADRAQPLADQIGPLITKVDERLPTSTETLVRVNGAAQLGGGLLLATGTAPRPAAAVLAGTLVAATVVNHPFWNAETSTQREREMVGFAKNMAILGGLLLASADTAGSPSLGWRVRKYLDDHRTSE
jgi:putative oxidoreductase